MTVPQQGPPQWGSGIPGIPSIWDLPRGGDGEQPPPTVWAPPTGTRPRSAGAEHRAARRWALGALGLTSLLLLGGVVSGGSSELTSGGALETFESGPVPVPAFDLGGPVAAPADLSAVRADGAGEPFGLPLGAAVLVTDTVGAGSLEVRPLSVEREGGLLLIDLELRALGADDGTGAPATPPGLVLRSAEGREAAWSQVRGTTPGEVWPAVLFPGTSWRGVLAFPAPGTGVTLAALGPGTVAAWLLPPV
jgi:hypothetical protein